MTTTAAHARAAVSALPWEGAGREATDNLAQSHAKTKEAAACKVCVRLDGWRRSDVFHASAEQLCACARCLRRFLRVTLRL